MRNSGYSNRDSYSEQTSYSSRDTYPETGRNGTRPQYNRSQYSQRTNSGFGNFRHTRGSQPFGNTRGNQPFGNQSFKSLDEAINPNEIHDVVTQRLGTNPTIFGEPLTITDAAQITECKNYGIACIANFLTEHRELGNLYMDTRYNPMEGKWSGCPMFAAQFFDKQTAYSKLGNLIREFRFCVRRDPAMNEAHDSDEAFRVSKSRKILDWFFDTETPSFFIEHMRAKLRMDPEFCGGISTTARSILFNGTEDHLSAKMGAGAGAGAGSSASSYSSSSVHGPGNDSNLRRSPRTKQNKTDDDATSKQPGTEFDSIIAKSLDFFDQTETPSIVNHPKFDELHETYSKRFNAMNLEGDKGLKAFATIKLDMTLPHKVLKKNLVPVLAHKLTVTALKASIDAGDYIDEPARHELPDTTPVKATSTDIVNMETEEKPAKRLRSSPRKMK